MTQASIESQNQQRKNSSSQTIAVSCLVVLTIIAITAVLMYLKAIMVPFVLSIFLFFMISPIIRWMQKNLKIPRPVAIVLALICAILVGVIFGVIFSTSIQSLSENMRDYQVRTQETILELEQFLQRIGLPFKLESVREQVDTPIMFSYIQQFATELLAILGNFGLILIYLIFFLVGQPMGQKSDLIFNINSRISKYIWMKLISSLATGILVGIILAFLGVDLAFMFGVLAFFANFIPNVGFLIATIAPLPLAFLKFGFAWPFWGALIIPAVVQMIIGNFFETRMMGKSLDLHPVTILFFLLVWGVVWGIPGMFLAVPITAIIKLVLEQFPRTQFASEILAGRLPV